MGEGLGDDFQESEVDPCALITVPKHAGAVAFWGAFNFHDRSCSAGVVAAVEPFNAASNGNHVAGLAGGETELCVSAINPINGQSTFVAGPDVGGKLIRGDASLDAFAGDVGFIIRVEVGHVAESCGGVF